MKFRLAALLACFMLMTPAQARSLVRRDPFEREVGNLLQYRRK